MYMFNVWFTSHNLHNVFIVSDIWQITNSMGVLDKLTLESFMSCKTCSSLPLSTDKLQRIWMLSRITYINVELVLLCCTWAFHVVIKSYMSHLVVLTCEYNNTISYWSSSSKLKSPSQTLQPHVSQRPFHPHLDANLW